MYYRGVWGWHLPVTDPTNRSWPSPENRHKTASSSFKGKENKKSRSPTGIQVVFETWIAEARARRTQVTIVKQNKNDQILVIEFILWNLLRKWKAIAVEMSIQYSPMYKFLSAASKKFFLVPSDKSWSKLWSMKSLHKLHWNKHAMNNKEIQKTVNQHYPNIDWLMQETVLFVMIIISPLHNLHDQHQNGNHDYYDYHDFHDSICIALSAATMAGSSGTEA